MEPGLFWQALKFGGLHLQCVLLHGIHETDIDAGASITKIKTAT